MTVIPRANAAQELSHIDAQSTQQVLDLLIAAAILVAIGNGALTCTFSTAGQTSADLQAEQLYLEEYGYTWSRATNTVTVSWA